MQLSKETVVEAINSVQQTQWAKHGSIIAFTCVYEYLERKGYDTYMLSVRLEQLAKEGYCEIMTEDITYGIDGVRVIAK